jgi:hypothetical protein
VNGGLSFGGTHIKLRMSGHRWARHCILVGSMCMVVAIKGYCYLLPLLWEPTFINVNHRVLGHPFRV